ncbi:MAG: alpha/beta hydrolase [Alphaproteobacteria bacterium]|nr:alpha/beta hydrolase [Alphaproteobacteria bacterium]
MRWWDGLSHAGFDALLGAAAIAQRALIYFPDSTRPEPDRRILPNVMPVTLETADGLSLLAWHQAPRRAGAHTLVYFHGNARHMGVRAEKIAPYLNAGYGGLLMSWRGFSGNPGRPTEQGLYTDGRAALAFLAHQGVSPERVILYGESLGTGVAVQLATEMTPAAVVLEAPYTSIPDVAAWRVPIAPVRPLVVDRFDSLAKIASVRAPLLVVHGEMDSTIPVRFGRRLFEAGNDPKQGVFIKDAGHLDLYDHGMAGIVLDFLSRQGLN